MLGERGVMSVDAMHAQCIPVQSHAYKAMLLRSTLRHWVLHSCMLLQHGKHSDKTQAQAATQVEQQLTNAHRHQSSDKSP